MFPCLLLLVLAQETPFTLRVEPTKERFAVEETIRFRVRSSRDAYLYMFVRDEVKKQVIPIPLDGEATELELIGEQARILPETRFALTSDREGRERFVFLASLEPLDINWTLIRNPSGETGIEATELEEKTRAFSQTSIAGEPIKLEIPVRISDEPPLSIAIDHPVYGVGETIRFTVASQRQGVCYVYVNGPRQRWELLGSLTIDAGGAVTHDLDAGGTKGDYTLLVVYRGRPVNPDSIVVPLPRTAEPEGVSVKRRPDMDRAKVRFRIE